MDYDKYDNQENQEVRRKRRRSRRHKNSGCAGTMVYVIAVVGASLVISLAAIFTANDVFAFVKDNAMQQFYVSENTKLADLAKDLDKQGIINYGTVFKAYLAVKGDSADDVLAGEYQLNPSMDYGQIIDKLTNSSSSDTLQITIPEGYSVAQVRQLLLDNHVCTADALDKVLNQYPFKHDFLQDEKPVEEGWLEGYLFPDTYEIYKGNGSVVDTVNKMLNNFASRYGSEITDGANELGRSMHDIVTVASLVEREAQRDDERARIAGVIYNRLNNSSEFPYLQVDASVLYGLGRTSGKLTDEDLKSDSPYNLYTAEGLPPGPICNPGYASLYAASHPESHDYYYYVAMPDGSHLFASSYEEHQRNIATSNAAQAQAASENTDQSTEVSGE
ncbi:MULTISPECIES: endolytic transglycosylase MltG [Agathobaculum]|uniref:Endolytic murein transglycosylase n=1 Tax=Agathobaculum hominis TaxID=2763014 RepID=A0ABR7GM61_9FIRM|nr:endolytic transglycosylase MltG [Agathobaculum hominis]MBC5695407.1 endolytic transglycosylase MltG [Agathobaculum hominis]MEE0388713.1 endolytic transglycosylase MltG [Agathobaculum sp.]